MDIQEKTRQISTNLRKIREEKGLSQKELAITIEVDPTQYSRLETGKSVPSLKTIIKIARALEVSIDAIVHGDLKTMQEVNVQDKTLLEKVKLIEELDDNQKNSLFTFIDTAIANKRLKDALNNAINIAS